MVNADALFDRSGIVRVGQVAGLLALNHLDVFVVEKITAAVSGRHGRDFAVLTPEIALADVVVVGDGNAGPAAEDFFEGETELQPRRGVFFVIVALIAREKDEIRILVIYVTGVFGAEAAVAIRVARQGDDFDFVFSRGVLADQAFEDGAFAMTEPVFVIAGVVPPLDAEDGRPPEIVDGTARQLGPTAVAFDLKTDFTGFGGIERIELRT